MNFLEGFNQAFFPQVLQQLDEMRRRRQLADAQGNLTNELNPYTNIPAPTAQVPAQPGDATHLSIPAMQIQGVPTTQRQPVGYGSPDMIRALQNYMTNTGQGMDLGSLLALQGLGQGKFTTISPGDTYGSVKGSQFTPQGTAAPKPAEKMYIDNAGQVHFVNPNNPLSVASGGITAPGGSMQGANLNFKQQQAANAPTPIKGSINYTDKSGQPQVGLPTWNKESKKWEMYDVGSPVAKPSTSLTSATRTMLEMAPTVKYFVDKIKGEVQNQEANLGAAQSRWREFKAGKIGLGDPAFTALRTNVGLLTTALMRMHVGARGGEYIMKHFQEMIAEGKQSPENLQSALDEINSYADQLIAEKGQAATGQPASPTTTTSRFQIIRKE